MFRLLSFLFVFAAFLSEATAFENLGKVQAEEYIGKFDSELKPEQNDLRGALFKPVADLSSVKLPGSIKKGATILAGRIFDPRDSANKLTAYLVVKPASAQNQGAPFLCADADANGIIARNECQKFVAAANRSNDFETVLRLPISTPLFKSFPIYLRLSPDFKNQTVSAGEIILAQSTAALATGRVAVNKRSVLVEYSFDSALKSIGTTDGLFGIDIDGDGKIRNEPFSPESSYAYKEAAVFRIGQIYVSTCKIDLEQNRIAMCRRQPEDYRRVDLQVGTEMPEFSFVDFDNQKRTLTDFRGKYLLIDFWGLWCIDCRHEIPFQLAAYQKFHNRGFEILGLDDDENIEPVKAFLAKNNILWSQARLDSIKNLMEVSYRIQEYPSTILLAPDGKVLILDQSQLKGEKLLETLDKLLR